MNFKLRTKLYFSHLIVLILPLIIIGFLFVKNTEDNNKLIRDADQLSTNANLAVLVQRVNDFNKSNIRDFNFFTSIPAVQGLVRAREGNGIDVVTGSTVNQWQSRFTQAAESILKQKQYIQEIIYLDEDNSEILKVVQTKEGPETIDFDELLEEREDKYLTFVKNNPTSKNHTTDIILLREEGTLVKGNIPVYKIAKNIFNGDGKRVGIISLSVYCEHFLNWFKSTKEEHFYLIKSSGHFAVHPDAKKRWGDEIVSNKDFKISSITDKSFLDIISSEQTMVAPKIKNTNIIKGIVHFDITDESKAWLILSEKNKIEVISALNIFLMVSGASIILAFVLITLITKAIIGPIINFIEHLNSTSGNTNTVSKDILNVSGELTDVSTRLATGTQQTMATLDEISAIVERNSENAHLSSVSTIECSKIALEGEQTMKKLKETIENIANGNNNIVRQAEVSNIEMSEIEKIIEEINVKTKVINDIVFQTKLLSFNASVEAARAGKEGAGFAVVAEEIGNLAKMSGKASNEIEQMLSTSITKVRSIVKDSIESTEKIVVSNKENIDSGHNVVSDCTLVFEKLVKRIDEIKIQISEVSSSAKEQIQGINNINEAMSVIDTASNSANLSATDASELSNTLNDEIQSLENVVIGLQTQIFGNVRTIEASVNNPKSEDEQYASELDNIIDFEISEEDEIATETFSNEEQEQEDEKKADSL